MSSKYKAIFWIITAFIHHRRKTTASGGGYKAVNLPFLLFAKVRLYVGVAQPLWAMC
ncbi:hypothetical protein [Moraxella catarrhalis]|uniref:hypothetical protein n=1 Tax=Moraxella catarrhalis TaxID=480 RepID=UPI0013D2227F|nr:hypothetical protein [Moraxella catarrhalis]